MQSVSSKIWTHVAVSISYDDNDYTMGTSLNSYLYLAVIPQKITDHFYKNKLLKKFLVQWIANE